MLQEAHKSNHFYQYLRYLAKEDLFFLLGYILRRHDVLHKDWVFERCKEVAKNPDGYIDLWAREHYKSTIITFAKTIQDILCNPEITIGIFSHTRPMAKDFLLQIKTEFEQNTVLQFLFSDILWKNPHKEAPVWSLDKGIVVRRNNNPKEATIEAWGLTDGQPIGKHFSLLIYDDIVTRSNVGSPEMIHKVTECWALSLNLGTAQGKQRYIGTRYHYNDTWSQIISRKAATPRIYPATKDGTIHGTPVLLSKATLKKKYSAMGSYVFSCQMLQNPVMESIASFKEEWIQYYTTLSEEHIHTMQRYIIVDPAGERKKNSDYSVFLVIGVGEDENFYILDAVRDKLTLTEKATTLFALHKKWNPLSVGYEEYGMQADIAHIRSEQERKNYHFSIIKLGGTLSKKTRIMNLLPFFEHKRIFFPKNLPYKTVQGVYKDFVHDFITEEYCSFPMCKHDDMLDCLARICDPKIIPPQQKNIANLPQYSILEYPLLP